MRNRCKSLLGEKLRHDDDDPFESNQSFPADLRQYGKKSNHKSWATISKWINQSVLCRNYDSFGSAPSLSSMADTTCDSAIFNKAVFTIALPSTQILIVNSTVCKLLDYSSEALCSKRLDSFVHDSNLFHSFLQSDDCFDICNGIMVDLISKGGPVPVFLHLQQVESRDRCIVIADVIYRRTGLLSIDDDGLIKSTDEDASCICSSLCDSSDILGLAITDLIPNFSFRQPQITTKQYYTCKPKLGSSYPLCVRAIENSVLGGYLFEINVYFRLPVILLLSKEFKIVNCNEQTVALHFGLNKSSVLQRPITDFLPDFGDDVMSMSMQSSGKVSDQKLSTLQREIATKFSQSLNSSDIQYKVWTAENGSLHGSQSDHVLSKSQSVSIKNRSMASNSNLSAEEQVIGYPMNRTLNVSNLSGLDREGGLRDGCFAGLAKHSDGGRFEVLYRISRIANDEGFQIQLSLHPRAMYNMTQWHMGRQNSSTNVAHSRPVSAASSNESINKDSQTSRQNSSSLIISQCDEVLIEGEYSEYYTNLQVIGRGAFGYVKTAYRNEDGLIVITKFIKKQSVYPYQIVKDTTLNMQVPLEVSFLIALDHPNIIRILDIYENENFFQMVMERHGAGLDLFTFLDRQPALDEPLMSYIFRQIVSAIDYLHSLGIVHRDIKDENIVINHEFQIKLIDFGSAAFMVPGKTLFTTFFGTVEYCSPEVLQGNKYRGPELEMWALGVTLYVLVFGENPFQQFADIIKGEFKIPWSVSQSLLNLLHGLIEKNVERRWDIKRVTVDSWINQDVDISRYCYEQIVRCYDDEAHPVQYIAELEDEYDNSTIASSDSFSSLHTIENEIAGQSGPGKFFTVKHDNNVPMSSTPRTKLGSSQNFDSSFSTARESLKRFSLDINDLRRICADTNSKQTDSSQVLADCFEDFKISSTMPETGSSEFNEVNKCDDDQFWDAEVETS